jgi:acetyl esterase/lipase
VRGTWGARSLVGLVIVTAGLVVANVADAGVVIGGRSPVSTEEPAPSARTGDPQAGRTAGQVVAAAPVAANPPVAAPRLFAEPGEPGEPVTKTYGPAPAQFVEITRPAGTGPRPAVIFVHGGSWVSGSTSGWEAESRRWAEAGWIAVNASYRLGAGERQTFHQGRNMLDDITEVLALTRRLKHVDPDAIVIAGDSAGGHLGAWVAGRHAGDVAGLVLWSPVAAPVTARRAADVWTRTSCEITCERQKVLAARAARLFGYSGRIVDPLYYLHRSAEPQPMWIAGSSDEWVPWDLNGRLLCEAAADRCTSHVVPGVGHGMRLRDADPALAAEARDWAAALVGLRTLS